MRPSCLPSPEDVPEGANLTKAVRVAELLLRTAIRPREVSRDILLGGVQNLILLPHFPIRGPLVGGQPPNVQWWAENDCGVIGANTLEASSWKVTYSVGYLEDQVPALVGTLVEKLACWYVDPESEDPQEILDVAEAGYAMLDIQRMARAQYAPKGVHAVVVLS